MLGWHRMAWKALRSQFCVCGRCRSPALVVRRVAWGFRLCRPRLSLAGAARAAAGASYGHCFFRSDGRCTDSAGCIGRGRTACNASPQETTPGNYDRQSRHACGKRLRHSCRLPLRGVRGASNRDAFAGCQPRFRRQWEVESTVDGFGLRNHQLTPDRPRGREFLLVKCIVS